MPEITIRLAQTDEDILRCSDVIFELRPHLIGTDLLAQVREQIAEGYQLAFAEAPDGKAAAVCGYRYLQFLFCGKHFYIDDLVTLPGYRGLGLAGALLDFVDAEARSRGFEVVTLDSGHQRHDAHRLYLNKGFRIIAHHFVKKL